MTLYADDLINKQRAETQISPHWSNRRAYFLGKNQSYSVDFIVFYRKKVQIVYRNPNSTVR
jgi:hypothetical protein